MGDSGPVSEEEFVLSLILEGERNARQVTDSTEQSSGSEESVETVEARDELFLINEKNVTRSSYFTPQGTDAEDDSVDLPVEGEGRLDNLIIIASSQNFSVTVRVDDNKPIDDTFSYVQAVSAELTHASAYSDGNEFIFHVSNYPFNEYFNTTIVPHEEIEFSLIRIEVIKG